MAADAADQVDEPLRFPVRERLVPRPVEKGRVPCARDELKVRARAHSWIVFLCSVACAKYCSWIGSWAPEIVLRLMSHSEWSRQRMPTPFESTTVLCSIVPMDISPMSIPRSAVLLTWL